MNVASSHMDNMSFHPETSIQKWKYVLQRRITSERELGEKAIHGKEIMKVIRQMNIVTDDGPNYEKLVKELRKVYARGKCVKLSTPTFILLGKI